MDTSTGASRQTEDLPGMAGDGSVYTYSRRGKGYITWFGYQYKAISRLRVLNRLVCCQDVCSIQCRLEITVFGHHLVYTYSLNWLDQRCCVSSKAAVHTLRSVLGLIFRQLVVLWPCKKAKFLVDSWHCYQRFSVYIKHGAKRGKYTENVIVMWCHG